MMAVGGDDGSRQEKQSPLIRHHEDDDRDDEGDRENLDGISLENLSLFPERKLLVLDLAGLLCDRVFHKNIAQIPQQRTPDANSGSFLIFKRPHCEEFVKFCLERFYVGIWSSAKKKNLDSALDCVIGGLRSNLLFVWDQDECTDSGFSAPENKNKPIFFKELKKLWENRSSSPRLPWKEGHYSSSNTLLIDDKPYKALLNPPHTAIFPTEYKADQVDDDCLSLDGELRIYLAGLAEAAEHVPTYVKEHPFGQTAITANHPDWDFYCNIIHSVGKQ